MSVAMASSALGDAHGYRSSVVRRIWIGGVRGHRRGISYCGSSPNDYGYDDLCGFLPVVQNVADVPGDGAGLPGWRCREMASVCLGIVKCRAAREHVVHSGAYRSIRAEIAHRDRIGKQVALPDTSSVYAYPNEKVGLGRTRSRRRSWCCRCRRGGRGCWRGRCCWSRSWSRRCRCGSGSSCRCGGCRCRCRCLLRFECADVDYVTSHPDKTWAPLIVKQRRVVVIGVKSGIPGINGWAAVRKGVREGWPAVVSQQSEVGVGIDLVAGRTKNPTPIITAHIITE